MSEWWGRQRGARGSQGLKKKRERERKNKTLSKQSELTNGVKEEVDVLGPLSLIVFTISVDVKQH